MIATIMSWLTSRLAGPVAAIVAMLALAGFLYQTAQIDGWPIIGGGLRATVAAQRVTIAAQATAQARFEAAAAKAVADQNAAVRASQDAIAAAYEDGRARARTVTRTITKEVPVYVPPQADAACPVPWGIVRLFDAAASGSDDAGAIRAAIAPGQPDASPSPYHLSDLAALFATNLADARANAAQLSALQAAVRAGGAKP